jgi:hypothetical protein
MTWAFQVYRFYVNWHIVPARTIVVFKWLISRQMTSRKKERKTRKLLLMQLCTAVEQQLCTAKI